MKAGGSGGAEHNATRSNGPSYDAETMDAILSLLPILLPLVIIQVVLLLLAIYDLFREDRRVRWFGKPVWACIIVLVSLIGPLVYFFVGREDV
jgi:hypothetical protein